MKSSIVTTNPFSNTRFDGGSKRGDRFIAEVSPFDKKYLIVEKIIINILKFYLIKKKKNVEEK